ncbi:MAG: phytoene desaturase family protein [Anaerolineales bacterium]
MTRVLVVGAGVGGLSTAALLAKAGLDVKVLESHIYPGGCAGTFYFQGYRFDAGATLAGGFDPGGPMDRLRQTLALPEWPAKPAELAMMVHLPDRQAIERWGDDRRWLARHEAFGETDRAFWRWQERTADAMWDLAAQNPPWPPNSPSDLIKLVASGGRWANEGGLSRLSPGLAADAFRSVGYHLRNSSEGLRLFVDAQLLISAQALSADTVALYGAAALDLPRRGVVHLQGGMIAIARHLVRALVNSGGEIRYRHRIQAIQRERDGSFLVKTERHGEFRADVVVANLTRPNLEQLLAPDKGIDPARLPKDGWGAFTSYLGVDEAAVEDLQGLHHQILLDRPLTEGNSVFLSVSPAWDSERAPAGKRAITLSTHTRLAPWWQLFEEDRSAYEARKEAYSRRMVVAAERIMPGLSRGVELQLPGTPVTFQRFTGRARGWVGGYPQTNLFRAQRSRVSKGLYIVGDSIFPGQSTAAVAMGGLRVGQQIIESIASKSTIGEDQQILRAPG